MKKFLFIIAFIPFFSFSQTSHTETTTYQYDNLNRLIQVDFYDGRTYNYAYDSLGNRLEIDVYEPKDIYLENLFVSATSVFPGDNIIVVTDFKYDGLQATWELPSFILGYHLAHTCDYVGTTLLGSDTASLGTNNNSELHSEALTIPANTPAGNYQILFYADMNDSLVGEDDELNNIVCVPITIVLNTTSVLEETMKNLVVFPNPTTGDITIQLPESSGRGNVNISISDINGKIVLEKEVFSPNGSIQIETNSLETGSYMLKVSSQKHNWSELFIKK